MNQLHTPGKFKYFLHYENDRNQLNTDLYKRFLGIAFGAEEHELVLVGHHFMCESQRPGNSAEENLRTINEIPSADTALFDHDIMRAVFGADFLDVIKALAVVPASDREKILESRLSLLDKASTDRYAAKEQSQATDDGMPESGWAPLATAQDVELEGGID